MYSENSLLLVGDQAEIQRFVKQAREYENGEVVSHFSFFKLIPIPKGLSDEWAWCGDNWGINCDMDTLYDEQKQTYHFEYDEPLAFPIRGFLTISKRFPKIRFTYESYKPDIQYADIALRCKIKFCNGAIESEKEEKVRIKLCPHCNRLESYERIA